MREDRQVTDVVTPAARTGSRFTLQRFQFRVTLGHRQAGEDEHGKRHQPDGGHRLRHGGAGDNPQRVQGRQHQHIHQHKALEVQGIPQGDKEIDQQDTEKKRIPHTRRAGPPPATAQGRQDDTHHDRRPAAREGTLVLLAVRPVGLEVDQVIDQVHRRGTQAKGYKRENGRCQQWNIRVPLRDENTDKHQQVLAPLVGTHGPQQLTPDIVRAGKTRLDTTSSGATWAATA